MSRKNFKVDTAQKGQTAKSENKHPFVYKTLNTVEKTNVPTGKVTILEMKKKRREEREKQYRTFRINALKRRAARMGIPNEKVQELVEKLCEQLDAPKQYMILMLFNANNKALIMQILKNANISPLMSSDSHMYVRGDQDVLAKLRETMPKGTKIHPYAIKNPPLLPKEKPPKINDRHRIGAKRKAKEEFDRKKKTKKEYVDFKKRVKKAKEPKEPKKAA